MASIIQSHIVGLYSYYSYIYYLYTFRNNNLRKELNKPNIEKKSTSLKIIVKNSGIKDPTQENLKKYIDLNIISIKKAKLDVGTLILEIDIKNIHKCKAENWKNVNKENLYKYRQIQQRNQHPMYK